MHSEQVIIRHPKIEDAQQIFDLVSRTDGLDTNSVYYYFLMCRDFSDTCAVAELHGRVVGVLLAFRRPVDPSCLFSWQCCIDGNVMVSNLAFKMFRWLIDDLVPCGLMSVEMSIDRNNRGIRLLVLRLARWYDSEVAEEVLFSSSELGGGHYNEWLQRIELHN